MDNEINIKDFTQKTLSKIPRESAIGTHWLAIEGVQPNLSQNLTPQQIETFVTNEKSGRLDSLSQGTPVIIKPLVKHVLSKELVAYYDKITNQLRTGTVDTDQFSKIIRSDPSIRPLFPYFIQFVTDEIAHNLKNLPILRSLIEFLSSLISNPYLQVELHVGNPLFETLFIFFELDFSPPPPTTYLYGC